MTQPIPLIIRSTPGIKRDGTQFDSKNYTDGLWCRFQRGLPRKMGGFTALTSGLDALVYGMSSFAADNANYIGMGMASKIVQAQISSNSGTFGALVDRTPVGFVSDLNNLTQFGLLPSAVVASATDLLAHSAPNLADIASTVETDIYVGQADLSTALVATGLDPVSGGVTAIGPYVFGYGSGGTIVYSAPNDPATQQNRARVTGQKIVYGLPLRGGGSGPAGVFWSLDAIVRATFIGSSSSGPTDPLFAFDELATGLNIMSSRSVIDYNGVYYWWDISGPMMFNGVVREVPNDMNINFFLDNLNITARQKVFAMKVPRWGEIWWCVPLFGSEECNWAIIYNVRENLWYDTPLPANGRTSGIYPQAYPRPLMTDAFLTSTGYTLWDQERGVNQINGTKVQPVPSHFTTSDFALSTTDQPSDKSLSVSIVEPDFVQAGDMTCQVLGRANSRAPDIESPIRTFPPDNGALPAADQVVRFKENRRELRFKFSSNTPDGNYEMGQTIGHVQPSDGRVTS